MTDSKNVSPIVEKETPQAQGDNTEQVSPSEEEKETIEPEEKEPAEDPKDRKIKEQAAALRGSKEEALRLKREKEELELRLQQHPQSSLKGDETQYPVTDAELAAFNAYAKKLGYVTRDEIETVRQDLYRRDEKTSLERFYQKYPEYAPENDSDDSKFGVLKEHIANWYKAPKDPSKWYDVLVKAHNDLAKDDNISQKKGEALGMAKANLRDQSRLGSASSGGTSTPKLKLSPEQQKIRDGFKAVRPEYYKD